MSAPIKKIKYGSVTTDIWENPGKEDKTFNTISQQRSYKDKKDKWQNTNTLRIQDIPDAIAGLQDAYKHCKHKEPNEKNTE